METHDRTTSTGMILGKFLPPHRGHQFLVDFGRNYVDELLVLVCTLACEPIEGALRVRWMQKMFPHENVRLVHVTDDLPQTPEEHPRFWEIWRDVVRRHQPRTDFVFASEQYGFKLAEVLDARYVPVDPQRQLVPVSGTAIRAAPLANWEYLPEPVRLHYLKRVCLFGPESTGKTTLAQRLAAHYHTVWVSEHARPLLDHKAGQCDVADIPLIARGQIAAEEAMARHANRLLICDTDTLLTTVWSEVLFGQCPPEVAATARSRGYDLYLLMDVNCDWVQDGQRYLADRREEFFDRCVRALNETNRPYVRIGGSWDDRFTAACAAIDQMLQGA